MLQLTSIQLAALGEKIDTQIARNARDIQLLQRIEISGYLPHHEQLSRWSVEPSKTFNLALYPANPSEDSASFPSSIPYDSQDSAACGFYTANAPQDSTSSTLSSIPYTFQDSAARGFYTVNAPQDSTPSSNAYPSQNSPPCDIYTATPQDLAPYFTDGNTPQDLAHYIANFYTTIAPQDSVLNFESLTDNTCSHSQYSPFAADASKSPSTVENTNLQPTAAESVPTSNSAQSDPDPTPVKEIHEDMKKASVAVSCAMFYFCLECQFICTKAGPKGCA
jgi:hypothetical protein